MKPAIKTIVTTLMLTAVVSPALARQGKPMQSMPMQNMPMKGMMQSANAEGVGVVQTLNPDQGTITIKHQAITSIHWPAMTMAFKVTNVELLKHVNVGEHVHFGLRTEGMQGTVTWIKPAGK